MAVDNFFKKPHRGSKAGGTKCTSCEVVNSCNDAGKCVHPVICVTITAEGCDADPIRTDVSTGAVPYECSQNRFDLSYMCGEYEIDLFITYEEQYGIEHAVLRSEVLNLEEWIEFTGTANARCPNFDFSIATIRPYAMVALGPPMCIDSGPEDCTAGRCLPRFLCGEVYTVGSPDEPYLTTLEWYTNDTVTINSSCCCNANVFPELLMARFVNYSDGCTCIGPKRVGSIYYTPQNSGASLSDAGAIVHLRHRVSSEYDDFLHIVPAGVDVWVSEGPADSDLVQVCPAPNQTINAGTIPIYVRMMFWCDPNTGHFNLITEIIAEGDSTCGTSTWTWNFIPPSGGSWVQSSNDCESGGTPVAPVGTGTPGETRITDCECSASTPYGPYDPDNPNSNIHLIENVKILRCNPFFARASTIFEATNCQNLASESGSGEMEVLISEFQGWVGPNPEPSSAGKQITVYTERTNTSSVPQTLATDCWPKMHLQRDDQVTFKERSDVFWIDSIWPEGVWGESEYLFNEFNEYSQIQRIVVRPKPCNGCEPPVDDPYGEVNTDCCSNPIPRTLYVTSVNNNDCPCAEGSEIILVYDDEDRAWVGEAPFGSGEDCGCTIRMRLTCRALISTGAWDLFIYFNDTLAAFWTQGDPSDRDYSCDPFFWITRSLSINSCCDPSYAASDVYWIITE